MTEKQFEEIVLKLPDNISRPILFLPKETREEICEIRLKSDSAVMLSMPQKSVFLLPSGKVSPFCENGAVICSKEALKECFLSLCNRSVYAHSDEIKEGYLSLGYGCRAGICGRFFEGKVTQVSSINIRISHDVLNCAESIVSYAKSGLLIAGPPASGKTTMLRDAVRQIASGKTGNFTRVSVIDSREEITAGFNMGNCCDVIFIKDKSKGIEAALRTMSPEIIAFDEIGTLEELSGVNNSLNSGVKVITTAHSGSIKELKSRTVTKELLNGGAIKYVALLSGKLGENPTVYKTEEIIGEHN